MHGVFDAPAVRKTLHRKRGVHAENTTVACRSKCELVAIPLHLGDKLLVIDEPTANSTVIIILQRHVAGNVANQEITKNEIRRAIVGEASNGTAPVFNVLQSTACIDDVEDAA